jgi:hypothetical protein
VIDHTALGDRSQRRQQVRENTKRWRRRNQDGVRCLKVHVKRPTLDQLEVKGILDPDRRGDKADEAEACEQALCQFTGTK